MSIERLCANPGCDQQGKHLCSGCGEEIYCSKTCQKDHWAAHKQLCQNALRPRATVSITQSFDSLSAKQLKNVLKAKAGSFDSVKRTKVLEQLENIVEKPALVKYVSDYVKISEVESLLAVPESSSKASSTKKSSSTSTSSASRTNNNSQTTRTNHNYANGNANKNANNPPTPTPEQMQQQAVMMRKNPELVRRSNPALAHFTDQQIRDYADQLEVAARDPNMMKEIEKMSKMTSTERERLQTLQEGLSGIRPMDKAWIDYNIDTLKNHTSTIHDLLRGKGAALGGVSDSQMESFINTIAAIDKYYLKMIIGFFLFLGSLSKPAIEWFKYMDKITLGLATYILMAIVGIMVYFYCLSVFFALKWMYTLIYPYIFTVAANTSSAATTAATSATAGVAGVSSTATTAAATVAATAGAAIRGKNPFNFFSNAVKNVAGIVTGNKRNDDNKHNSAQDHSSSSSTVGGDDF